MTSKRIIASVLALCITAILVIAVCGCEDLGTYEDTTEYYDLCTLYDKAGRINTVEQEQIVNNERGNAFIITGPTSRTNIEIVASPKTRALFNE